MLKVLSIFIPIKLFRRNGNKFMYACLLGLSRSKTECVFGTVELILLGLYNKNCRCNIKLSKGILERTFYN